MTDSSELSRFTKSLISSCKEQKQTKSVKINENKLRMAFLKSYQTFCSSIGLVAICDRSQTWQVESINGHKKPSGKNDYGGQMPHFCPLVCDLESHFKARTLRSSRICGLSRRRRKINSVTKNFSLIFLDCWRRQCVDNNTSLNRLGLSTFNHRVLFCA